MSDQSSINDEEERRAFARIEQALSELGNDYSPPQGWESRVLAAAEPPPKAWWQRWQLWALPAVPAAATAFALALFVNGGGRAPLLQPLAFESDGLKVVYSDGKGKTAKVMAAGAPAHVVAAKREVSFAAAGAEPHRALRVYRKGAQNFGDGSLIFSCESAHPSPSCEVSSNQLVAKWSFPDLDQYKAVMVAGSSPIPSPQPSLDAELRSLDDAGLRARELRFEVDSLITASPPSQ